MNAENGRIETAETGEQYFVMGKNRIKITEHFSANGRTIEELLADYIQKKIKEKPHKTEKILDYAPHL